MSIKECVNCGEVFDGYKSQKYCFAKKCNEGNKRRWAKLTSERASKLRKEENKLIPKLKPIYIGSKEDILIKLNDYLPPSKSNSPPAALPSPLDRPAGF